MGVQSRRVQRRSSPHTRGWSQQAATAATLDHVFPAYAGVPSPTGVKRPAKCLPRMRGSDPLVMVALISCEVSSLHAWGVVSESGKPYFVSERLPRMRGGGPSRDGHGAGVRLSSPHARGWSRMTFPTCPGHDLSTPITLLCNSVHKFSTPRVKHVPTHYLIPLLPPCLRFADPPLERQHSGLGSVPIDLACDWGAVRA